MSSVGINPPKTPVTKGSNSVATATVPNICKMPGPPAPFVPAPLPNIGKSGISPQGYSTSVKIEGNAVAIRGASFGSMGDMASKGTGGGMVSANTHGPCKFIGPGSMDVMIEGKNVQLLSDPMTNNGAGSGTPANAATMIGAIHAPTGLPLLVFDSSEFPEKTLNMQKKMGKTKTLTRQEGKSKARKNRRAALKTATKGGAGTSLDEFPFASTKEGGTGAAVEAIDVDEQNKQGGKMSSFYQHGKPGGIKDGDKFVVQII